MFLIIIFIKLCFEVLVVLIFRRKKGIRIGKKKRIIIVCILYNCLFRKFKGFNKKIIRNNRV